MKQLCVSLQLNNNNYKKKSNNIDQLRLNFCLITIGSTLYQSENEWFSRELMSPHKPSTGDHYSTNLPDCSADRQWFPLQASLCRAMHVLI